MFESDCDCCRKNDKKCWNIVIGILVALITFVVGILIGAFASILVLLGLSAFVAILAILIILLIITIIFKICYEKERHNNCC